MRILLVSNEFPPDVTAGTAFSTERLARHLILKGHVVRVMVTGEKWFVREKCINGIETRQLSRNAPRGIGLVTKLFYLWKEVRMFHPDIIQGQGISCGLLSAVIGHLLNVPSITFAQGQDVYQAKPWQRSTEIRWACHWASGLAAVTDSLARRLISISGRRDIRILPHGIELKVDELLLRAAQMRRQFESPSKVVLSVGRLEHIKGHDILLDAWPEVLGQFPSAQLWIVGNGSRAESLSRQAELLGVKSSVTFWGALSPCQTASVMSVSDLFVLPSRSEAFGICLLEAMGHGLPVVTFRVGGIPDVIPLKGDVYIAPAGDLHALAAQIRTALIESAKPSSRNRQWALNYEWDRLVDRFEHFYVELLVGKNARFSAS